MATKTSCDSVGHLEGYAVRMITQRVFLRETSDAELRYHRKIGVDGGVRHRQALTT